VNGMKTIEVIGMRFGGAAGVVITCRGLSALRPRSRLMLCCAAFRLGIVGDAGGPVWQPSRKKNAVIFVR
jgi:hypothetical protein